MAELMEQETDQITINQTKVTESCQNLKAKGYKIMVVYQPITGQSVSRDFYVSMLTTLSGEIFNYMMEKHHVIIKPVVSGHFPIDYNRNAAVQDAIDRYKADYMFFMDTDQTFPGMAIVQLYEAMLEMQKVSGLCVMAGMYFLKKCPWSPVFGRYTPMTDLDSIKHKDFLERHGWMHNGQQTMFWNHVQFWERNSIFKVDVIGAGCMMMDTDIFKRLKKPYFKYSPDPRNEDETLLRASEDMWFCSQLYKNNVPIYMNSSVSCGHLAHYEANEALFASNRDALYSGLDKEKRSELYGKILDVRGEEEKAKFRKEVLEEV